MGSPVFKRVAGSPSAWQMEVGGRVIACASVRGMGARRGIYWFNCDQTVMTREAAEVAVGNFLAGLPMCRFRDPSNGDCTNYESAHVDWPCAGCGLMTAGARAEHVRNGQDANGGGK